MESRNVKLIEAERMMAAGGWRKWAISSILICAALFNILEIAHFLSMMDACPQILFLSFKQET